MYGISVVQLLGMWQSEALDDVFTGLLSVSRPLYRFLHPKPQREQPQQQATSAPTEGAAASTPTATPKVFVPTVPKVVTEYLAQSPECAELFELIGRLAQLHDADLSVSKKRSKSDAAALEAQARRHSLCCARRSVCCCLLLQTATLARVAPLPIVCSTLPTGTACSACSPTAIARWPALRCVCAQRSRRSMPARAQRVYDLFPFAHKQIAHLAKSRAKRRDDDDEGRGARAAARLAHALHALHCGAAVVGRRASRCRSGAGPHAAHHADRRARQRRADVSRRVVWCDVQRRAVECGDGARRHARRASPAVRHALLKQLASLAAKDADDPRAALALQLLRRLCVEPDGLAAHDGGFDVYQRLAPELANEVVSARGRRAAS
jgi:hypothetical protein